MIDKENILNLEKRQDIYQFIEKNPGLHIREISRRMEIPLTTLTYHLKYLKKLNIIEESNDGKNSKIFVSGKISRKDKKLITFFRQDIPCRIFIHMLFSFTCTLNDLSKELEADPATVYYHLKKMMDMELIEKAPVKDGVVFPFSDDVNQSVVLRKPVGREVFYRRKSVERVWHRIYRWLVINKDGMHEKELIETYMDYLKTNIDSEKWVEKCTKKKIIERNGEKVKYKIIPKYSDFLEYVSNELIRPPFCA